MTTKKAISSQQVLLSAKRLAELGNELTDIMNVLEMNNLALEGLEFALQNDTTTFLWLAKKTLSRQSLLTHDRKRSLAYNEDEQYKSVVSNRAFPSLLKKLDEQES